MSGLNKIIEVWFKGKSQEESTLLRLLESITLKERQEKYSPVNIRAFLLSKKIYPIEEIDSFIAKEYEPKTKGLLYSEVE